MEHVERGGQETAGGKRKVTWDGGVWAVDAQETYKSDDVFALNPDAIPVEEVGPTMLAEMRRHEQGG